MAGPSALMGKNSNSASTMHDDPAAQDHRRLPVREASEDGTGAGPRDEGFTYLPFWVRLACIGLDFLTQTYDQIRIVPELALFEQYVCRAHYANEPGSYYISDASIGSMVLPPELCKTPDVQYQLARLRSWKAIFDGVTSME